MSTFGDDSDDEEFLAVLREAFKEEAREFLGTSEQVLMQLEGSAQRAPLLDDLFRNYHSIKGSASAVGMQEVARFAHVAEDCLAQVRNHPERVDSTLIGTLLKANDVLQSLIEESADQDLVRQVEGLLEAACGSLRHQEPRHSESSEGPRPPESSEGPRHPESSEGPRPPESSEGPRPKGSQPAFIKIHSKRLDDVMDLVGELVVIKSQLIESGNVTADARHDGLMVLLDKTVRDLHERTLAMRMLSLKPTFLKLQRTVRDLASILGKPISFEMAGEDTEIDRALIDRLTDPLTHLIRNAVDHGIESPKVRIESGKSPSATVSVRAFRQGEMVVIEVRDDGGGIDREAVLGKAIAKGLVDGSMDSGRMADKDVFDLMFQPGFSTAKAVTDISGRGVGLDVVRSNLESIKGRIEVESAYGRGSVFRCYVPLTTAITEGVLVMIGGRRFILPLDTISRFVAWDEGRCVGLGASKIVEVNGEHLPLLSPPLGIRKDEGTGMVAVIEAAGRKAALRVKEILGRVQVVLKPISHSDCKSEIISGAAVTGDGTVALVFDVGALLEEVAHLEAEALPERRDEAA